MTQAPTATQVLRDAADVIEEHEHLVVLDALIMAAAVLTSTHRTALALAQDAMAMLARQLCYAPGRNTLADLAAWGETTPRDQIAASMREAADHDSAGSRT